MPRTQLFQFTFCILHNISYFLCPFVYFPISFLLFHSFSFVYFPTNVHIEIYVVFLRNFYYYYYSFQWNSCELLRFYRSALTARSHLYKISLAYAYTKYNISCISETYVKVTFVKLKTFLIFDRLSFPLPRLFFSLFSHFIVIYVSHFFIYFSPLHSRQKSL